MCMCALLLTKVVQSSFGVQKFSLCRYDLPAIPNHLFIKTDVDVKVSIISRVQPKGPNIYSKDIPINVRNLTRLVVTSQDLKQCQIFLGLKLILHQETYFPIGFDL